MSAPDEKHLSTAPDDAAELIAPNTVYPAPKDAIPAPEIIRGVCPECADLLVSNMYFIPNRGYLCVWQCWSSLIESPTCDYRRVL